MIAISRLDKQKHKMILMQILLDISKNNILKRSLVFKWWTAFFLLYNLPRFSTDLDFDSIWDVKHENILQEIESILSKYGEVKNSYIKKNTIFTMLSYGDIDHNIKMEISLRWVSGEYSIYNFMWIPLNVLKLEYLTANKFITLLNRKNIANRDIYDIWFILKNQLEINKKRIEDITKKPFEDYITSMIDLLQNLPKNYNILDGLGLVIDEDEKTFVKNELIWEVVFLLNGMR